MRPGIRRVEARLRAQERYLAARNARLEEEQPDRPLGSADAGRGTPTPTRPPGSVAEHFAYIRGRGPAPDVGTWRRWPDLLP
jgi:hypothetical protein